MLKIHNSVASLLAAVDTLVVVGTEAEYRQGSVVAATAGPHWDCLREQLKDPKSGPRGTAYSSYTGLVQPKQVIASVLPDTVSRNNTPTRKDFIYNLCGALEGSAEPGVVLCLSDASHLEAALVAVTRRLRPYLAKSTPRTRQTLHVVALHAGKVMVVTPALQAILDGVQWACTVVDSPPTAMGPAALAAAARTLVAGLAHVSIEEIIGLDLVTANLGGIYGVGKAAAVPPRALILRYEPAAAKKTIALVGKGLTFDTGGLNLKVGTGMIGMKNDMAGAAAIFAAFHALAKSGFSERVVAMVGICENAIGPLAQKPDDIVTMHSGKTVELNNTDAEGRLVLADCASYLGRTEKPHIIIEAATLTGAQGVATGNLHAAVVTNRDALEALAVKLGKETGDLVAPLPFAPELFQEEFASVLADMKNSVKNRANAQSSCAAQFVYAHIQDLDIPWVHIDMAYPAMCPQHLATGYGVSLVTALARQC